MRRTKALALVGLWLSTSFVAANEASDMINGMDESERRETLGGLLRSSGKSCPGVTRTFFQGTDKDGAAYWNAACTNAISYNIQFPFDIAANTRIVECSVLAMIGVDCFTKLASGGSTKEPAEQARSAPKVKPRSPAGEAKSKEPFVFKYPSSGPRASPPQPAYEPVVRRKPSWPFKERRKAIVKTDAWLAVKRQRGDCFVSQSYQDAAANDLIQLRIDGTDRRVYVDTLWRGSQTVTYWVDDTMKQSFQRSLGRTPIYLPEDFTASLHGRSTLYINLFISPSMEHTQGFDLTGFTEAFAALDTEDCSP